MRGRRKTLADSKEMLKAEGETPQEDMVEPDSKEKGEAPVAKSRRGKKLFNFRKKQQEY